MKWRVRLTKEASDDLVELHGFIAAKSPAAARRARLALTKAFALLETFPFSCRKAEGPSAKPLLRELIVPFGKSGYVALFEIDDDRTVTILAVRDQRAGDYY